jgi:hypothetical protein
MESDFGAASCFEQDCCFLVDFLCLTRCIVRRLAKGHTARVISGLVRRSKRSQLIRRFGTEHIVRCQRTSNTFERKLTHRLDRDRVFDRREYARTD